ncbi:hypothetical protein FQZ97_907790 [compost metagenome]
MQNAAPQAVELQVGIEALEGHLFLAGLADAQAPEVGFQAEGVELQALQRGGRIAVQGELLVGDAQADAGQDQKPEQAVEDNGNQQGASGALYSFKHKNVIYPDEKCFGVWHARTVPDDGRGVLPVRLWLGLEAQDQGLQRRLAVK